MARTRSSKRRKDAQDRKGWVIVLAFIAVAGVIGWQYSAAMQAQRPLDDQLCPISGAENLTVLLVDLTDPLTVAQKQDFSNQLELLRDSIPKYGRFSVYRVDAADSTLLLPVIDICNPGDGSDLSDNNSDPQKAKKVWTQKFNAPLELKLSTLTQESGAVTSPIFQTVQSVALTSLHEWLEFL